MSNEICLMCNQIEDNPYEFGEKITFEGITVHYFCLLLSSKLPQNGKDDEGIYGFLPADILLEKKRASKKKCIFCHEKGANITCCDKKCQISFHVPCAVKQDCRFEFFDKYKSFCDRHHNIKETDRHQATELCRICTDEMGEYNVIRSIRSPCCKSGWYHKKCLSQYAATAALFMKCTICNLPIDNFRQSIEARGVYIPERDAMWEEPQQSIFYEFEQHNMRPNECAAEQCQMPNGRNYCYDETNQYLLNLCTRCGSMGVHECCLNGTQDFICHDCGPPSTKRRKLNDESTVIGTIDYEPHAERPSKRRRKLAKSINETVTNNNVEITSPSKPSQTDFVLWTIRLKLPPSNKKN